VETLAPAQACRHRRIRVDSHNPTEFIDVTDRIQAVIGDADIGDGLVNVHSLHTTTAVVVNEHEPLLLLDFAELLARTASQHIVYRHDDMAARSVNVSAGERANGHGHCRALLLGCSAMLNVAGGRLQLGRWQRVFLVELDGPRSRELSVMVLGTPATAPRSGMARGRSHE
jgi:secondary thiamine-phosphate synthase enzyme